MGAERAIRTLKDSACTLRQSLSKIEGKHLTSSQADSLWGEFISFTVYVRNRLTNSRCTDITPYESIFKRKPNLGHVRPFGTIGYAHIPDQKRKSSLDAKSKLVILVGFDGQSSNYRVFDATTNSIEIVRNIRFQTEVDQGISGQLTFEKKETSHSEEGQDLDVSIETASDSTSSSRKVTSTGIHQVTESEADEESDDTLTNDDRTEEPEVDPNH